MRIVCAVDGSEFSQWGIGMVGALAERKPEHVTVLHVVNPAALSARGLNPVAEKQALSAMEKAGALLLREAVRAARVALGQSATAPLTKVHSVLAHGALAQTITRQARRAKADLIVMGSRGLSDIERFLLGSISRQVVTMASCPVLVVKKPVTKLTSVILAVDDSKHSRSAARFIRSRFLPDGVAVTIVSAAENPVTELAERYLSPSRLTDLKKPVMEKTTALVNGLRNDFIKDNYSVITHVNMDHVIETIVKQVEAKRADLLVIGSRALTKSERRHLGSVSESLLKYAPCSVLVVRGARA